MYRIKPCFQDISGDIPLQSPDKEALYMVDTSNKSGPEMASDVLMVLLVNMAGFNNNNWGFTNKDWVLTNKIT